MPTRALGQKNVPGIAQNLRLEAATILTEMDIVDGALEVMNTDLGAISGWSFVPPRFFIS